MISLFSWDVRPVTILSVEFLVVVIRPSRRYVSRVAYYFFDLFDLPVIPGQPIRSGKNAYGVAMRISLSIIPGQPIRSGKNAYGVAMRSQRLLQIVCCAQA